MKWEKETIEWLKNSYKKYSENCFDGLWLPEYPVLDDSINDSIFMPKKYVIMGNSSGNIELPRIINKRLQNSYNIDYCRDAYKIQTANGFNKEEIYNPIKTCPEHLLFRGIKLENLF